MPYFFSKGVWRVVVSVSPYVVNDRPSTHERTLVMQCAFKDIESVIAKICNGDRSSVSLTSVEYLSHAVDVP